jgi:hypothetical protein
MPNERQAVDAATLRQLFNDSGYYLSVQSGEFSEEVVYEGPPSRAANQTAGTVSQRVRWYDASGRWVATVHQYVKPDGSLGGSGRPDPKQMRIGSVTYSVDLSRRSSPLGRFRSFTRRHRPHRRH